MNQKVLAVGLRREKGYLYFIDKQGDISRCIMARGKKGRQGMQKVAYVGLQKESGFLYFIDKEGDISRSVLQRGRR
jgi:hypothetical protein